MFPSLQLECYRNIGHRNEFISSNITNRLAQLQSMQTPKADNALRRQRRARGRRSLGTPFKAGAKPTISHSQIGQLYAHVIKLSAENKINSKNSWKLPLIDHIDSIINKDEVNFQKASCTLDASVQIYSSRVDDTYASSFRMIESLNRSNTGRQDPDAEHAGHKATSTTRRKTATKTLEKDPSALSTDAFDSEFKIDSFFHKMSKVFDEGGAKGLLLANLEVQPGCRLVFEGEGVADVDTEISPEPTTQTSAQPILSDESLQLAERAFADSIGLGSMHAESEQFYSWLQVSNDRLNGYSGGGGGATTQPTAAQGGDDAMSDTDDDEGHDAAADYAALDSIPDLPDVGSVDVDADAFDMDPPADSMDEEGTWSGNTQATEQRASAGQRRSRPSLDGVQIRLDPTSGYGYITAATTAVLPAATVKSWAGLQHWSVARRSVRRAMGKPEEAPGSKSGTAAGRGRPKKRGGVDFCAEPVVKADEMAPAKRGITLSKAVLERALTNGAEAYLLPADAGMQLRDLHTLLSCDQVIGTMVRQEGNADQQGCMDAPTGNAPAWGVMGGDDDDDDDADMGFDGGAFNAAMAAGFGDAEEESAGFAGALGAGSGVKLIVNAQQVDEVNVHYERTAKKVDVKQLKHSIWQSIDQKSKAKPIVQKEFGSPTPTKDSADGNITFQDTIVELAPRTSSQVTVPFYFICLLHLANENNLELHDVDNLDDLQILREAIVQ